MIAKFRLGEIILRGDGQPRLVERIQPGFGVFSRNAQRAIGKRLSFLIQLLQVRRDRFRRGLEKPPQLRFDIKFPFGADSFLVRLGRRAEDTLLRRRTASRVSRSPESAAKVRLETDRVRKSPEHPVVAGKLPSQLLRSIVARSR